jgi:hypothetical protein
MGEGKLLVCEQGARQILWFILPPSEVDQEVVVSRPKLIRDRHDIAEALHPKSRVRDQTELVSQYSADLVCSRCFHRRPLTTAYKDFPRHDDGIVALTQSRDPTNVALQSDKVLDIVSVINFIVL